MPERTESRPQSHDGGNRKSFFFQRYRRKAVSEAGHYEATASIATGTSQEQKTSHSFSFPLPFLKEARDKEVPGTFQASRLGQGNVRGRWFAEGAQIAYKLVVRLEPKGPRDESAYDDM